MKLQDNSETVEKSDEFEDDRDVENVDERLGTAPRRMERGITIAPDAGGGRGPDVRP